ncbi:COMM domain-containing protein 10 [Neocloeon triangulifer]|uniref:COMM domain-containing protein 10 n=1 Tax=Neocloeon triangulifer TaxID=2078957 RepID=UPI00286EFAE5|nr:COMM domain-containing protein 10 [Neocloeon triangulifer]
MLPSFSNSATRDQSIKAINEVESSKFPLLVNRLAHGMQVSDKTDVFTQEELIKLESSLGVDESGLKSLLDSLNLILTQAALTGANPTELKEQLGGYGIAEEKAFAIVEVWQSSSKQIIESLKERLAKPTQLDDIQWSIGAAISSKSKAELKSPHATIQFSLKNDKNDQDQQPITVQMNHEQLLDLHQKLQGIQDKLDSLK